MLFQGLASSIDLARVIISGLVRQGFGDQALNPKLETTLNPKPQSALNPNP